MPGTGCARRRGSSSPTELAAGVWCIAPNFLAFSRCCQAHVSLLVKYGARAQARSPFVWRVEHEHLLGCRVGPAADRAALRKGRKPCGERHVAHRLLRGLHDHRRLCAYLIGLVTEVDFGSQVSLIVFLTLYFAFLWISWLLAVWVTEPKHATAAAKSA